MPEITCVWCTPRPGVADILDEDLDKPDGRGRRPGWHQATHYGTCGGCGEQIQPGDTIRWGGRSRLCEDCGANDA
jgi:hypothetical protein